jgi:hypothetical protein
MHMGWLAMMSMGRQTEAVRRLEWREGQEAGLIDLLQLPTSPPVHVQLLLECL